MKLILTICICIIYASALMAGCGPSKEKPDILIEASLCQKNTAQDAQPDTQLSHDFDRYHPDQDNFYSRVEKNTNSIYPPAHIALGHVSIDIKEACAKIFYYTRLNETMLFPDTQYVEVKINKPPKKVTLDTKGTLYALICAKTIEPYKQ